MKKSRIVEHPERASRFAIEIMQKDDNQWKESNSRYKSKKRAQEWIDRFYQNYEQKEFFKYEK